MNRLHSHSGMMSADEALRLVLDSTPLLGKRTVSLPECLGRAAAEDLVAGENLPPFDNSSMDGYAILSPDVRRASNAAPRELKIIGESSAGNVFRSEVMPGTAVRIMTGGKIPGGADAVVPVEDVTPIHGTKVFVDRPIGAGQHIRRAGEDVKRGEVVVRAGDVIGPAHLAVLGALGCNKVKVFAKPHVNILATGDELVEVDEKPADGQIRNSNSVALAGYVRQSAGVPHLLGIVPDKKKRIRDAIATAPKSNILLITGGVSVGSYDFVKEILQKLGVQLIIGSVNIKPGRPLVFGRWGDMIVFGLPGNPVSTSVTFLQYVRPAMRKMAGCRYMPPLHFQAIMDEGITKRDGKRYFMRGIAGQVDGIFHVRTTGTQSSGAMSSMVKANCLIILPESTMTVEPGDTVEIELL